ncbi:PEP-CTERM sorting domain-containing protein [Frankia sp. RB7]|nr:PEP-CTERM sorting domain-containing protein [Frankia sp. RB7]
MRTFLLSVFALFTASFGVIQPSPAKADVVWSVNGTFQDGTSLTGTFTINVYGYLAKNYSLTTQANGDFSGFTYTSSNSYFSNGTFYVDFQPGYKQDLHLAFLDSLLTPNPDNPILGATSPATGPSYECINSYSCYDLGGGTVRYLGSGFASAVPEPSTWVMMLLGFAGFGFAAYRRPQRLASAS